MKYFLTKNEKKYIKVITSLLTRVVFHAYFRERFFFGKEKINRFEFLT